MEALIILLAIVTFMVTTSVKGADSRDGNDWVWHPRP